MDPKLVDIISRHIYRRFPDSRGLKPRVRRQPANGSPSQPKARPASRFLLTYQWRAAGPGGKPIPRLVRVIADINGRILKVSTSK